MAIGHARRDVILVVLASFAFATAGPLGKTASAIPAVVVACARTGIAAIVLALLARGALGELTTLTNRQRAGVALAGTLLAGHFALFLAGLANTSLAAAVSLVALEPIAVVLASFVAFRLRPTVRETIGLVVATLGALVVGRSVGEGEHRLAGDLLVLGAVVLYGAYVAAARGLRDALSPLPYAVAVYTVASIVLLPVAIPLAMRAESVPQGAMLSVIGLGLIPTAIGHSFVQTAARRASPALVGLVAPGETLGSLAIGALLMGTSPTTNEGIGAAVILLGATLVAFSPRAPR
jgi:drug/metabolite transporter (DMT)-like permease